MDASDGPSKHTLLLMFGLPILTTAIVCSSMYVGHILTKRADARTAAQQSKTLLAVRPAAPKPEAPLPAPAVAAAPSAQVLPAAREEKPEPRVVPMSAPAVPAIPATPVVTAPPPVAPAPVVPVPVAVPAPAAPVSKPAPSLVAAPSTPAVKKPSVLKPPAIPTPLLVPGKVPQPQKSSRAPIDTKPYPQRVVPEPRVTLKPVTPAASAPAATSVSTPVPAPAPSPAPIAAAAAPIQTPAPVPIPEKPAARVDAEQPKPQPVVVTPKPETRGDVAAVEPVRRAPVVAPAPAPAPAPVAAPAPAPVQAVRPVAQPVATMPAPAHEGRLILASTPSQPPPAAPVHKGLLLGRPIREDDLSLDLLYALSIKYIEAYCSKQGKDAAEENKRWMKRWMDNVEQAMMDGDSSEQQYINRVTIAKRDCFNIEKASPEKVVEGCRILLRYRDGNFTWLSAMREALTRENLLKTLNFLNAGPQI